MKPTAKRPPGWIIAVGSVAVLDLRAGILLAAAGLGYELSAGVGDVLRARARASVAAAALRHCDEGTTLLVENGPHPGTYIRREQLPHPEAKSTTARTALEEGTGE
jgi:hypothetical protein